MLNKVQLIGHLGKDPELRQAGQSPVANFSIATTERWKNKDGEKQEKTEWHRIVVWRALAETCDRYLGKGSKVYIEGKIQTRKWQDNDGNDRYTTEVVAHNVVFLDSKKDRDGGGDRDESPSMEDDDVPF